MKAVVATFNQEKALVGAFSVITNLRMQLFEALNQAEDCVLKYTWAGEDRGWNDFSCEKDTWVHQGVTMEIHALCEAPIIPSQ